MRRFQIGRRCGIDEPDEVDDVVQRTLHLREVLLRCLAAQGGYTDLLLEVLWRSTSDAREMERATSPCFFRASAAATTAALAAAMGFCLGQGS